MSKKKIAVMVGKPGNYRKFIYSHKIKDYQKEKYDY